MGKNEKFFHLCENVTWFTCDNLTQRGATHTFAEYFLTHKERKNRFPQQQWCLFFREDDDDDGYEANFIENILKSHLEKAKKSLMLWRNLNYFYSWKVPTKSTVFLVLLEQKIFAVFHEWFRSGSWVSEWRANTCHSTSLLSPLIVCSVFMLIAFFKKNFVHSLLFRKQSIIREMNRKILLEIFRSDSAAC